MQAAESAAKLRALPSREAVCGSTRRLNSRRAGLRRRCRQWRLRHIKHKQQQASHRIADAHGLCAAQLAAGAFIHRTLRSKESDPQMHLVYCGSGSAHQQVRIPLEHEQGRRVLSAEYRCRPPTAASICKLCSACIDNRRSGCVPREAEPCSKLIIHCCVTRSNKEDTCDAPAESLQTRARRGRAGGS